MSLNKHCVLLKSLDLHVSLYMKTLHEITYVQFNEPVLIEIGLGHRIGLKATFSIITHPCLGTLNFISRSESNCLCIV